MEQTAWGRYFAGAPTPFDADGNVDKGSLARQVRYFIDSGCSGLLACGFTGEWFSLTRRERAEVLGVAVQTAAGQIPVVAFVGSTSLSETLELMKDAENGGAAAVAITPPSGTNHDPKGILETYRIWCDAAKLPIMLYNLPSEIANNLRFDMIVELAALPNVVAMKDAPVNVDQAVRTAVALDGKLRLFGAYMDRVGINLIGKHGLAHGYLGSGMLFGQWMPQFFDAIESGNLAVAANIADRFERFSTQLFNGGLGHYWAVVKLVTDVQANTVSYSRLPVRSIRDAAAIRFVRELLDVNEIQCAASCGNHYSA